MIKLSDKKIILFSCVLLSTVSVVILFQLYAWHKYYSDFELNPVPLKRQNSGIYQRKSASKSA